MPLDQDGPPPSDQLAARALRQMVADPVDRLHAGRNAEVDVGTLHNIVGLWEANNLNEELTYDRLVAAGTPTTCDDCGSDVMPYDDYGRPIENSWEWYMVRSEVWGARAVTGPSLASCASAAWRGASGVDCFQATSPISM